VPEAQAFDISENTGVINDTTADVFKAPDTQSERVTQAIFNQPANILEQKDNWVRVKVVDGYTGWMKSKYINKDCSSLKKEKFEFRIVVTAKTKKIYSMVKGGVTLKDVVMGTELYCRNKVEDQYEVALPGNVNGWISESGTMKISPDAHIPKTTAMDFIMTANKLKGTTYLWGGVSYWGIDCSGLTYICSRMNGVDLPRDADQQFQCGEPVTGGITFFQLKRGSEGYHTRRDLYRQ
jgi:cell wall-associated NlpC family hydrolase